LVQFDFNLTRSFNYFGEGRRLEFRWDMLNLFNNTHFGLPDHDVSSKTFGRSPAWPATRASCSSP